MPTMLEQYRISDFLDWHREQRLVLNPDFQRGNVWTPAARSYLIDTVLRQLPMPKIYLRTTIDLRTKGSVREVVDGQQRLRAIIDFANDKFALTRRASEFAGLRYSTLSPEQQQTFLEYPIAVGQLLNATDSDVLEVFARLNSYSVQLNPAEKRHAKYQGDLKWAIRGASRRWSVLWDRYRIVSPRQRVRMLDDSLMAEMFGILMEGVRDGGQPSINGLYNRHDASFDAEGEVPRAIDVILRFLVNELAEDFLDTPLLSAPHFLMLFAALAHAIRGIPPGDLGNDLPPRNAQALSDLTITRSNLQELASVIDMDEAPGGFEGFWRASKSSTQRISSRRVRFPVYYRALLPGPL
jgi:hypothetical protein